MVEKFKRLICKLFGCNQVAIQTGKNDRSTWGWFHCSRCGEDEGFQYDEQN